MGCASSKLDDLPAVALCRDRCSFLDEAIHQRYALAAAHLAYINSLNAIGHSLHSFIQQEDHTTYAHAKPSSPPSSSPSPSPPHKSHLAKAKHISPPSSPNSDSGSHLHFHSDSDDSLHHSPQSSPLHLHSYYNNSSPHQDHHPPSNFHMNFMKNSRPASSIVYQQRPMTPETAYVADSSSNYYPYNPPQDPVLKLLTSSRLESFPKASSKMLHLVAPSLSMVSSQPSTSKTSHPSSTLDGVAPPDMDPDVDLSTRARHLSSTLQKLYLWEKKLYHEVKAEEKMRVDHDRKCRKLKRLDERGADFNKVDTTRTSIRSLSTKIKMAIQVVDKISMTISNIRDGELWPLLKELIQG